MSASPLLPLLDAFRAALSGPLPSQPTWRESALPGEQDALPSIALQLGDEALADGSHAAGLAQVRTVRLAVIVADDSQAGAEQCAWEVQEAAPYDAQDAEWSGNERAEHATAERHYFTVRVNFDVTLNVSIPF